MNIKILTFILAFSLSFTLLLVGCGKKPATKGGEAAGDNVSEEKIDLKGYEVKFVGMDDNSPQKTSPTYKDEMDFLKKIEKKYNCKMKFIKLAANNGGAAEFTSSVLAGSPLGDYWAFDSVWAVPSAFVKNLCEPLDEYMDLNSKQWLQCVTQMGEYKGKHYTFMWGRQYPEQGLYFNKRIFEKDALPDLYELQKNKQWTWDKMLEIAKQATRDTDGDGKIDQWGFSGGGWAKTAGIHGIVPSNGASFTRRENGKAVFALDDPAAVEALQFAYDLLHVHKVVDPGPSSGVSDWAYWDKQWIAGKTAMYNSDWCLMSSFKESMKSDKFGFVFFPMGPKAKDYTSWAASINIALFPRGVKHPKEVGRLVSEYYGPHSWDLDPKTLYESYAFDEGTVETCLEMEKKGKNVTDMLSYPFMTQMVWSGYQFFVNGGKSAKTWVESLKLPSQKSIDEVWSSAK